MNFSRTGFFVGLVLLSSSVVRSEDSFTVATYRDLYAGIVRQYGQGFSSDPFEDPNVKMQFTNPNDDNVLFKMAAESETRRVIFPKKKVLLIHPSYLDWANNKNFLRDKFGNSDFYLVQVLDNGLQVVGRMALYRMCRESMNGGSLFFNCQRVDQATQTNDVYKWDGTAFSKIKSTQSIKRR
jgi:hypothetical protein